MQNTNMGLFGLASSAQLENDYMDNRMVSPQQLAMIKDPLQQLIAISGNAGSMVGNSVGRMMGTKVPGAQQAEAMEQATKSLNWDDPDEMEAAVGQISQIDPRAGQELARRAAEMRRAKAEAAEQKRQQGFAQASAGITSEDDEQSIFQKLSPYMTAEDRVAAAQKLRDGKKQTTRQANIVKFVDSQFPNMDPAMREIVINDDRLAGTLLNGAVGSVVDRQKALALVTSQAQTKLANSGGGGTVRTSSSSGAGAPDTSTASGRAELKVQQAQQKAIDSDNAALELINDTTAHIGKQREEAKTFGLYGPGRTWNPFAANTGLTGAVVGAIPGTDAYDFKTSNQTLAARAAFGTLQEMRANSPTGGALGSVTEGELKLLEASVAAMETAQSYESYQKALNQYEANLNRVKKRILDRQKQMRDQTQGVGAPTRANAERRNQEAASSSGGGLNNFWK